MPPTEPPNDQNTSLTAIASKAFGAYNAGGPPDRAGLTWDGKPVPAFDAVGVSVQHKWSCAASEAALAGARYIIELVRVGQHDPKKLEASALAVLGPAPWAPPAPPPAESAPASPPSPATP